MTNKLSWSVAVALVGTIGTGWAGAAENTGRRHYITIQVTDYPKDGAFARSRPAKRDSKALPDSIGYPGRPGVHVRLSDTPGSTGPKPTAAVIRKTLEQLVADDRFGPDDELIVHVSAVGFESPTGAVVCPSGASLDDPDSMILVAELVRRVRLIRVARTMIAVDSCRNSIKAEVKMHAPTPPVPDSTTRPAGLKKPAAFVLIQAASDGQYAYNCPNSEYGILTCQFVAAMKHADATKDGSITVGAVRDFLLLTVPKSSRELYQAEQVPMVTDESSTVWVLATVEKQSLPPPQSPPVNGPGAAGAVTQRPPAPQTAPGWYTPPQSQPARPSYYTPPPPAQRDYPVLRQAATQAMRYGLSRIR